MDDLEQKIEDVIKTLKVKYAEGEIVTALRIELEKRELAISTRQKKVQDKELEQNQTATLQETQRAYIEKQTEKNERLLAMMQEERSKLMLTSKEREDYDKNNEYLKIREQALEKAKEELERDKTLFQNEKDATNELVNLLEAREKRIKAREQHLDNIDKQTQL